MKKRQHKKNMKSGAMKAAVAILDFYGFAPLSKKALRDSTNRLYRTMLNETRREEDVPCTHHQLT